MYKALAPGAVNLRVSFEQACELCGAYGFGGLEWNPLDAVAGRGVFGAQDVLGQYGVMLCSFGLPVDVQGGEQAFLDSIGRLESHARAARDLGIHRSYTWIPSWSDELEYQEYYNALKRRLGMCAEVFRDYGIRLGLEFLGPQTLYAGKRTEFIHTMDGMLELCADIGDDVGLLVDAYHCYAAGMDMGGCLAPLMGSEEKIVLVHINDAMKGMPLSELPDTLRYLPAEGGGIDLAAFFGALGRIGYTGPVIAEPFSQTLAKKNDPEEIMQALASAVEDVWPRS